MDQIYARLGTLVEPAPLHKLPSADNIHSNASIIELIRPLANRQSLNQLFNSFVISLGLVLDEGIDGAVVQELNQAMI